LVFYNSARFKLVSSSPLTSTFPTSSSEIVYTFNEKLDSNGSNEYFITTISPNTGFSTKIIDHSFHIQLTSVNHSKFTVTIYNIKSAKGSRINKLIKNYNVDYVPENKLSEYELNKNLSNIDTDAVKYPIINQLPIYGDYYIIDYQISDGALIAEMAPPLILKIRVLGVNRLVPATKEYLDNVHKMAIEDIKNRGFEPATFTIIFDDSPM
jgi:hypothetical protein